MVPVSLGTEMNAKFILTVQSDTTISLTHLAFSHPPFSLASTSARPSPKTWAGAQSSTAFTSRAPSLVVFFPIELDAEEQWHSGFFYKQSEDSSSAAP